MEFLLCQPRSVREYSFSHSINISIRRSSFADGSTGFASLLKPPSSSCETVRAKCSVGQEVLIEYRPLAVRNEGVGNVFRVQGALLKYFREYLTSQRFTEIITSKIVASGTEGGTNLFELKYFDRAAYLAQSPQFYKQHGVAGFERVYETGHVYRAEPHASSRHLTEYYSLDYEVGFIDGPEDVIEIERHLLTSMFDRLNKEYEHILAHYRERPLPSMLQVPIWEFARCLDLLNDDFGRTDLTDDLDPESVFY